MSRANGANKPLSIEAYQRQALLTAIYPDRGRNLRYPILGLVEEVGELAGHLKRIERDDGGVLTNERRERMLTEAGDILWYLSALSFELGLKLPLLVSTSHFRTLEKAAGKFGRFDLFGLLWRLEYYLGQAVGILGQSRPDDPQAPLQPLIVLWAAVCVALGSTPEAVARANLTKLAGRAERDALHGEGDER